MTDDESIRFRIEVLLSLQRALWDLVTPNLWAVTVRPTYPHVGARFIYEDIGQEERLLALEAEAFMDADFVRPVTVTFEAVRVPVHSPLELTPGEEWVYRRREGEGLSSRG